jgi:hypothetical protein
MNLAFDFNAPEPLVLTAPPLPHNGKPTSQSAAASVERSGRALIDRERVYQCVLSSGKRGMTRRDLEEDLALDGNTLRPRVWELLGNNGFAIRLIETEETRAPDCNPSGRRQSVLVVASWSGGEK